MFDVNTEAQLLKNTALRFDHLVLGVDVILIKNKRGAAPGSTIKAKTADVNTCWTWYIIRKTTFLWCRSSALFHILFTDDTNMFRIRKRF